MSIQLSGADIIDVAVQTEIRGHGFYQQAAQRAQRAEVRELFEYLAREEQRHAKLFGGLSGAIVVTEIDPTTWDEAAAYIAATVDAAFFGSGGAIRSVPQGASIADMLQAAIGFEKETLLYFYSIRDLVQPANRALVDDIIAEEKRHVTRLTQMLAKERDAAVRASL
jgi:rubrerythrin